MEFTHFLVINMAFIFVVHNFPISYRPSMTNIAICLIKLWAKTYENKVAPSYRSLSFENNQYYTIGTRNFMIKVWSLNTKIKTILALKFGLDLDISFPLAWDFNCWAVSLFFHEIMSYIYFSLKHSEENLWACIPILLLNIHRSYD